MNKPQAQNGRLDIVVATPHQLTMRRPDGAEHMYECPPAQNPGEIDYTRVVRAGESRRPLAQLRVMLGQGNQIAERNVILYELDHQGLAERQAITRLMANLGVAQCVAVSRMGGRFLRDTGLDVTGKYCHPAQMVRNPDTGAVVAAERLAIPQPTDYRGQDFGGMHELRNLNAGPYQLLNYYPQDMLFLDGADGVAIQRSGPYIDIEYAYTNVGETTEGVVISHSRPHDMRGEDVVKGTDPNTLILTHWEALIEGLRIGAITPEQASRMVFPMGVQRRPDGQQGPAFTALGCYSPDTLARIFYTVKT